MKLPRILENRSRLFWLLAGAGFLALVATADYLTGVELSLSVFYLLGIGLVTWFLGRWSGLVFSALSVLAWFVADTLAGATYSNRLVPIWNCAILLAFYAVVVWLLDSLHALQKELEERVRQRTKALTEEIAERQRLEKEILEVSEREQRRIGRDLHDSLCQHLTGTALTGEVLREKLEAQQRPESSEARRVVDLVEEGIQMARGLSRGLYPVDMGAEGLMAALQELAVSLNKWSKVGCVFEHESAVLIEDADAAMHLYRIAQEAVANALRHGKPTSIVIALSEKNGQGTLTVEDDGLGLADGWQGKQGLGMRSMAHRAAMIGGSFEIDHNPTGGTIARCAFPTAPRAQNGGQNQYER